MNIPHLSKELREIINNYTGGRSFKVEQQVADQIAGDRNYLSKERPEKPMTREELWDLSARFANTVMEHDQKKGLNSRDGIDQMARLVAWFLVEDGHQHLFTPQLWDEWRALLLQISWTGENPHHRLLLAENMGFK